MRGERTQHYKSSPEVPAQVELLVENQVLRIRIEELERENAYLKARISQLESCDPCVSATSTARAAKSGAA